MHANQHLTFLHNHDKTSSRGGKTVALELNDKREVVAVAIAHCHEKDNFCRAIGRAKAGGRLNSPRYRTELDAPVPLAVFKEAFYADTKVNS